MLLDQLFINFQVDLIKYKEYYVRDFLIELSS